MSVLFENSETKRNVLRAFAGESQARNRYTFAAGLAKKNGLKPCSGENIAIDGTYPVDLYETVLEHLRAAQHNEYQEWEHDYTGFAHTAKEEGFPEVSHLFSQIARIEQTHGDRFGQFADLLEQNKLFISETECQWMCLNCGYLVTATRPPELCPVCKHPQGFFVRVEMVPFQMKR